MSKTQTLSQQPTGYHADLYQPPLGVVSVGKINRLLTCVGTAVLKIDTDTVAQDIDGNIGFATHDLCIRRTHEGKATVVEAILPSFETHWAHAIYHNVLSHKGKSHDMEHSFGALPPETHIDHCIRTLATNIHETWKTFFGLKALFEKGTLLGHCDIRHQRNPGPCSCIGVLTHHESTTGYSDEWVWGLRHPGVLSSDSAAIIAVKGSLNARQLEDQFHWRWVTGTIEAGHAPEIHDIVHGLQHYWNTLKTDIALSIVSAIAPTELSEEKQVDL